MKFLTLFILFTISTFCFAQNHCAIVKQSQKNLLPKVAIKSIADMAQYDSKHVKLELEMDNNTIDIINAKATIINKVIVSSFTNYVFELNDNLTIDSLKINNILHSVQTFGFTREVALLNTLNQNAVFVVEVFYHGTPSSGASSALGSGVTNDNSPSWGNVVTWTLSQPYSAADWWPCKQALNDKLDSCDVWVKVPKNLKAGSNGKLLEIDSSLVLTHIYKWHNSRPIDYYLISVAIAKYKDYSIYAHPVGLNGDSILIQNYIYDNPNTLAFFKNNIDITAPILEYFSDKLGIYPFYKEKYGHCMAPLGGGMEHQTMTTIGSFANLSIIAHELGHQWFGDNVTCATWKDIFINEGFASYTEQLFYEQFDPTTARPNMDAVHQSVLGNLGGSIYVDDTSNVGRIFDTRLSYDKGNAVIHSLRFEINNDSLFFLCLRNFQQTFANKTATIENLKTSILNSIGIDYSTFFNQWIYGEGYPKFSLKYNTLGSKVVLSLNQTTTMPSITPLFKTSIEIKLKSGNVDTTIRVFTSKLVDTFYTSYSEPISSIEIDPNQWILNGVGTIVLDTSLNPNPPLLNTENELNKINLPDVYPNPYNDQLHLKNINNIQRIEIFNQMGQLIQKIENLKINNKIINTLAWPNGAYLINFIDYNSKTFSLKTIKN
jgi:aminopeptidase N